MYVERCTFFFFSILTSFLTKLRFVILSILCLVVAAAIFRKFFTKYFFSKFVTWKSVLFPAPARVMYGGGLHNYYLLSAKLNSWEGIILHSLVPKAASEHIAVYTGFILKWL